MKTTLLYLVPILLLWGAPQPCWGQTPYTEAQVEAQLIERFTRFVDWPPEALNPSPEAPFLIGVLGPNPFGDCLEEVTRDARIQDRAVRVVRLETLEQAQTCHLLFIPGSRKQDLSAILQQTARRPILTVGDTDGFAEKGVLVNFYHSEKRLRFEINLSAARRSGLRFSSRILRSARILDPEME